MLKQNTKATVTRKLKNLQKSANERGLQRVLHQYDFICKYSEETESKTRKKLIIGLVITIFTLLTSVSIVNSVLSARCLLPSNYFVWEATRPLADCSYCENVTKPIILRNVTRQDFSKYAYSSDPIIVKNAVAHWRATKEFSYSMFKRLYERTKGSYESLDEGCQFLNFKTDLFSLKEVFSMPKARAQNDPGQEPWYVGWGNCHPDILSKVRKYYSIPDFLPEDAEFPATENIFFGYEIGAVMHLDYIPRLMWQGQVKGNKTWSIAPVPECDHKCYKFQYYVEPGDIGWNSSYADDGRVASVVCPLTIWLPVCRCGEEWSLRLSTNRLMLSYVEDYNGARLPRRNLFTCDLMDPPGNNHPILLYNKFFKYEFGTHRKGMFNVASESISRQACSILDFIRDVGQVRAIKPLNSNLLLN